MNSSLDTTWVGTGVAGVFRRAGASLSCSSSLNMPMVILPMEQDCLSEARHHLGPEYFDRLHEDRMRHETVVSVAEHPIDGLALLLGFHRAQDGIDRADIGIALGDHFHGRGKLAGLGVLHALANPEGLEPGAAGELAGITPQRHRLLVA